MTQPLAVTPFTVELNHPFRIAGSQAYTHVSRLLIELYGPPESGGGLGEVEPSPHFGETIETAQAALEVLARVLGDEPEHPSRLRERCEVKLPGNYAAKSGLDLAAWDAYAKRCNLPLHQLLGIDPMGAPCTSFTIGIDEPDAVKRKVEEADQYPILKIKLGTDRDVETIKNIRSMTDKILRVDANAAWTSEAAIRIIRQLEDFNVELVEQPVAAADLDGMRRVRDAVSVPIIADESVRLPEDVRRFAGVVDGINVKLNKCGGISPALEMIKTARECGMKVMIGCMVSTSVSISAAAQLSPLADYADLDGALLIRNDPFQGVVVKDGKLVLPAAPGLGLIPK